MGLRFSKSIKLGKGVNLNLSKSGVGMSVGTKGLRVGTGPRGSRISASIHGTGIGYEKRFGLGKKNLQNSNFEDKSENTKNEDSEFIKKLKFILKKIAVVAIGIASILLAFRSLILIINNFSFFYIFTLFLFGFIFLACVGYLFPDSSKKSDK